MIETFMNPPVDCDRHGKYFLFFKMLCQAKYYVFVCKRVRTREEKDMDEDEIADSCPRQLILNGNLLKPMVMTQKINLLIYSKLSYRTILMGAIHFTPQQKSIHPT